LPLSPARHRSLPLRGYREPLALLPWSTILGGQWRKCRKKDPRCRILDLLIDTRGVTLLPQFCSPLKQPALGVRLTIVIALKVGDGVVLGADSATVTADPAGNYVNSYFNAEKLFNLSKGIPVGAMTYGLGTLAGHSIGYLAKDLRIRFEDSARQDWFVDPSAFTVQQVAEGIKRFFYDELYTNAYAVHPNSPDMGFLIAGYAAGATSPEVWRIAIKGGSCIGPDVVYDQAVGGGAVWEGQGEACHRLLLGYSPQIVDRLTAAGMTTTDATNLLQSAQQVVQVTMPIQDAIDLVRYLLELTGEFVRFVPGLATVAEPFDIAAVTRHEGFRWVCRKHYYSRELNLPHP